MKGSFAALLSARSPVTLATLSFVNSRRKANSESATNHSQPGSSWAR